MKKIIFLVLFLCFTAFSYAQRQRIVYLEMLGSGFDYSLNFDAGIAKLGDNIGYRLGVGYRNNSFRIPFLVNFVWGEKHGFELGSGVSMIFARGVAGTGRQSTYYPTANVMYRFQGNNGLNFRIGLTPILIPATFNTSGYLISTSYWLQPGLSLGLHI